MDRSLDEITPWIIEKWRTTRLKDGIAHSSVNRDTAALKGVLSKAVEWGVIDVHPLSAIKPLKVDHSPNVRYLSESEEESLRRALIDRETQFRASRESANKWRRERGREELPDISDTPFVDHLRPIVLLAINTGMRRGEIFNLGWGDVDLVSNMVTIKGKKSKSGHTRYVPLNDEVRETLLLWKGMSGGSGLVFPSKDGNPLDNVRRAWGTALEMAEITDFRFHDLRHHFASRLVMEGTDLNTVRELLGHSDIKMTLRYAHLSPEHKAEAVARLVRNR
jgi:integrase